MTVLIIYCIVHVRLHPFKYSQANHMESVCMFMLILGLITIMLGLHDKYPEIISFIMSLIVLIPCIMLIIYILLVYHNYRMDKKNMNNYDCNGNPNDRIKGMKSRLTVSQMKLFTKSPIMVNSNSNHQHIQLTPIKRSKAGDINGEYDNPGKEEMDDIEEESESDNDDDEELELKNRGLHTIRASLDMDETSFHISDSHQL